MSVDVSRLRTVASALEGQVKTIGIVYPIVAALGFFIGSYPVLSDDAGALDRLGFTFVGFVFGRMLSSLSKLDLSERLLVVTSLLELSKGNTIPETVPAKVDDAVSKVEIPAQPKLPEIPSVAAPPEVKEALKAAKGKGKPTKLPPKRKPKTVPPAQA